MHHHLQFPDDATQDEPGPEQRSELGQATAEYALVIIGAATIAALLIAWATGTGAIGRLLDAVLDAVIGRVA